MLHRIQQTVSNNKPEHKKCPVYGQQCEKCGQKNHLPLFVQQGV